jgi:hypothetical protein
MSIRVAIAEDTPENIVDRKTFKTGIPSETMPQVRWPYELVPSLTHSLARTGEGPAVLRLPVLGRMCMASVC